MRSNFTPKRLALLGALLGSSLLASAQTKARSAALAPSCFTQLSTQSFNRLGSATGSGNCTQLTPNQSELLGTAWHQTPLDLTKPFDLTFTVTQSGGADGMMFILQNDGNNVATNALGGELGYYNTYAPHNLFQQSLAIEFDIYNNGSTEADQNNSHIALVKNRSYTPVKGPFNISPLLGNGAASTVRLTWDPAITAFSMYRNGSLLFTHTEDIRNTIFGGNPTVYFGFTGATGGISATQSFCAVSLTVGQKLASIAYANAPYCVSTGVVTPTITGLQGGTFSSTPGLAIDPATGAIDLAASQSGNYVVTYSVSNGQCVDHSTFTLGVRPSSAFVTPIGNRQFCAGTLSSEIAFPGSGSLTYAWTNNNTNIGLAASGTGAIPSFMPQAIDDTTVSALIGVQASGGTGCSFKKEVFRISVNPTPVITGPNVQIFECAGSTTSPVVFQSNLPGTTFTWTNSSTTNGLAASGTGNLPAFKAVNELDYMDYATITVTPSLGGCSGAPLSGYAYISPAAGTISYGASSFCRTGTATVTRTASNNGSFYSYPGGLSLNSATGTVNLAASQPGTYTVEYYLNAYDYYCDGYASTTITIRPQAAVDAPNNPVYCSGTATQPIVFTGSASSYTWTNDNPSIGLALSGTGNIPSFNTVNNGATAQYANIRVTPIGTGGSCPGKTRLFRITVNPCGPVTIHGDTEGDGNTARIAPAMTLSPNPAQGNVRLQYSGAATQLTVQVLDASGVPVLSPISFSGNNVTIGTALLRPGSYQVVLTDRRTGAQSRRTLVKL
ncbi:lectin-like domain-containing protein [Flaviaesturariibacter amylovorans]|uniref:T9SS type A sorting domain-containing protein n=1 Tax=Flaviaesturariibacter amylovorans TaxID=1084520 RepID=A0ABP8HF64_9BACT